MTSPMRHFETAYTSPIPYPDFYSKGPTLCSQIDSELYFPESHATKSTETLALKAICGECPYKVECLEWALVNREDGIWGGTTNGERAAMRGGLRSRSDVINPNRIR